MSWKNRLMKKEKNKRNKQFGIKCKETNHLIELLGMLCLFGLMNLWEVVFPEDTIWNRAISILLGGGGLYFGSIIFFVGLTLPRYRFSKPSASLDMNLR